MAPKKIIDMIKLKLYIGNKRKSSNIIDTVIAHENIRSIEAERNDMLRENSQNTYWKHMCIDKVNYLL